MPPKEEKTTRQLKKGDETPAKKGQRPDQSGEEKLGGKKRSDEPEKKKVGPSQQ